MSRRRFLRGLIVSAAGAAASPTIVVPAWREESVEELLVSAYAPTTGLELAVARCLARSIFVLRDRSVMPRIVSHWGDEPRGTIDIPVRQLSGGGTWEHREVRRGGGEDAREGL